MSLLWHGIQILFKSFPQPPPLPAAICTAGVISGGFCFGILFFGAISPYCYHHQSYKVNVRQCRNLVTKVTKKAAK